MIESITALLAGFAGGTFYWHLRAQRQLSAARVQATALVEAARSKAKAISAEGDERVAWARKKLIADDRREIEVERRDLADHEADIIEREQLLAGREKSTLEFETHVAEAAAALDADITKANDLEIQTRGVLENRLAALEAKCGQTRGELCEQLVRDQVSKVELASLMRLRETEEKMNEDAPSLSRMVMQVALERYDGPVHLEPVKNTLAFDEAADYDQLATVVSSCRTPFLEETGCEIVCDELARSVTVRGEDPLAREVARRVLRQLTAMRACEGERLRQIARQAKGEIEREVQNAGRRACRVLNIGRLHPDVLSLVGRLKYRLSYSQNQWRHSIEVGYLAGILADELGLDAAAARRGGLLHDIGKAMTHDHDGSHAVLGAEVARRCGEDEIIANAIGSHHNDEPVRSAIANIVTAADALSGGRPGARRESVTQYLNRIQDIQRIASRSPAVRRVDIMHAGREVRVVVAGEEQGALAPEEQQQHRGPVLTDGDIQPLAAEIARGIEKELTFAGQIRVTVIRESHAIAVAR